MLIEVLVYNSVVEEEEEKKKSQNNVSDLFRLTMKGYYITSTDLTPVVFGIQPPPFPSQCS